MILPDEAPETTAAMTKSSSLVLINFPLTTRARPVQLIIESINVIKK